MNAIELRSQQDLALYDQLLKVPDIVRLNEKLAREADKGNLGVRRHLLSTSVRLSRGMAKDLHATADNCAEVLGVDIPLELYVFPSPSFNAACVKPEAGRLFVMFSSSILEAFTATELKFVMGHELGHHLYGHHDIPIGYVLRGEAPPNPRLALTLTSWSRYAEISADRAGAYCARDLAAVAHALFKLASGLTGSFADFTVDDFLTQVDEMQSEDDQPGQGAPTSDWFLTHPFSPLRVKALSSFHGSEFITPGGMTNHQLDSQVEALMSFMEPSYLEGKTDTAETMRRLLFAAAIAVADASNGISDAEKAVFDEFFGHSAFSDKLDVNKIKSELDSRITQALEVTSVPQRMQVLRDLCSVSQADGHTTDEECAVLRHIAKSLDVPVFFIDSTLSCDKELD